MIMLMIACVWILCDMYAMDVDPYVITRKSLYEIINVPDINNALVACVTLFPYIPSKNMRNYPVMGKEYKINDSAIETYNGFCNDLRCHLNKEQKIELLIYMAHLPCAYNYNRYRTVCACIMYIADDLCRDPCYHSYGNNILYKCSLNNDYYLARYILKKKVKLNEEWFGRPVLFWAYNKTLAQLLIKYGASVNVVEKGSKNTLLHNVSDISVDLLSLYINEYKLAVNTQNKFLNTPLHCLVQKEFYEVCNTSVELEQKVKLLVSAGAHNMKNIYHETPYDILKRCLKNRAYDERYGVQQCDEKKRKRIW